MHCTSVVVYFRHQFRNMDRKQEILEAYQRAARKYQSTIGIAKFEQETGIKESEWENYWHRFAELQKEAGYTPNTFGTKGFADEEIFEKFIALTKEIGEIPVTGHLKVKHTHDTTFPSVAVFQRKFSSLGGIRNFIVEVMKYAKEKHYSDIIELCEARLEKDNKAELGEDTHEIDTMGSDIGGYVYLGKRKNHYKVGVTNNLPRRRVQMETLQPDSFEYLHVYKTHDPYKVEAYWKEKFKPKLVKQTTEWFKLNSSDVKAFANWIQRIF